MKKRKITMLFLIAGLLFSGCGKSDASDATDISSVELKSNQKIVIGKITEIAGNEMTYTILKKVSAKSSSSDQSKNSNSGNAPDQNGNGNDSSNAGNTLYQRSSSNDSSNSGNASDQGSNDNDSSNGSGGMPAMQNGSSSQGQMPSGGQGDAPGNPPDANGMQDQQNSNSDSSTGSDSSKSKSTSRSKSNTNSKKKSMTMYTSANKSATMTIPVGTDVITSLGNKTTFSRLSNGDVIKMIVETDQDGNKVIVGIWMV